MIYANLFNNILSKKKKKKKKKKEKKSIQLSKLRDILGGKYSKCKKNYETKVESFC